MRATGLPDGAYTVGDRPAIHMDGAIRLADGTLAGSVLALVLGVAACGGSDSGDQPEAQSGPRTLNIWLMTGSASSLVVMRAVKG